MAMRMYERVWQDYEHRTISLGGGVDSTALLVMAVQGRIPFASAIFANVGEDSENPRTLTYLKTVLQPYAAVNNFPLIVQQKTYRKRPDTLVQLIERSDRSIPIPMRLPNGAPARRACTVEFKIKVVQKFLRSIGVSAQAPALVAIGFTLDDWSRVSGDHPSFPEQHKCYPLIEHRLTRNDCKQIIINAGLPVPEKSSCVFCPFKRLSEYKRLYQDQPDRFWEVAGIERMLSQRSENIKGQRMYLTDAGARYRKYLHELVIGTHEQQEFDLDAGHNTCDTYSCFT